MAKDYTYEVEKLTDTKYKVVVKVSKERLAQEKENAYQGLAKTVEIKGFRPGKGPRNLIEAKLGARVYEETINKVFPKFAVEVIQKEELNPVGQLEYHLEKVSDEEGLHYHFEFEAIGKVSLPDFEKLSAKKEDTKITKKEVDAVIEDMLKQSDQEKKSKAEKDSDSKKKKTESKTDKPEITEEWIKSLGIEGVKDEKGLRDLIKAQLTAQKEKMEEEKYVAALIDEAVEKAGIKVPETLVKKEVQNRESSYKKRIEELGLEYETFLKTKDANLEDLKADWKKEAQKRIGREILLVEVAKTNNIRVAKEEIDKEIEVIQDPNAKKQYQSEQGRNFIASVIIQQKAVQYIKDQKQGKNSQ